MRPWIATASLTLLLCGCAAHGADRARMSFSRTAGRVVALIPSFADDLYAVGAGDQLVAVSAYTDVARAKGLPRVADASSVDVEEIVALRPSAVIGIPAQARFVEPLRRAHVPVFLLADDSYDAIFANLRAVGEITGHRREAEAEIARLQRETAALERRTSGFARRPSVFVVLGNGPIWTAGAKSYISELIELAGGRNAAGNLPAAYGEYSAEALLRDQPDLLVTDPATHLDALADREPWRSLRAVRLRRVYAIDPDVLERPGPSYNEAVRRLLERIAPLAQR
ncbi:MAG: ABC transporter substrate-binding protein [Candidatus Eremiobacteraeota bacterium]|nr:ABC transporter substrate-binding protein [Candidatus Eremiobacteraeota bacterium]